MPDDSPIIVAGTSRAQVAEMLPFGRAIADVQGCSILVLGLVAVPEERSLSTGALQARALREGLEPIAKRGNARVMIHVAHDTWSELGKCIADEKANLLLLHWQSEPPQEWLERLICDIAFVKPPFPVRAPRILLPIRGGPYAAASLRIALGIAQSRSGQITALHSAPLSRRSDSDYPALLKRLSELPEVTHRIHAHGNPIKSIVRAGQDHQLIVMGAAAQVPDGTLRIGAIATQVLTKAKLPGLVVRAAPRAPAFAAPGPEPEPVDYTISVIVDKWFAENTFHAREFEDLNRLVALKEKQGLTISLGLPTLNEEKTIGKIIEMMRTRFMESCPLLDEIVVIDSNSTDATVDIATRLGVPVVKHPEVLTQYEKWRGKGEALWNSLYILKGDLIAWIDTDIVNIHPRFVYGILGPLIREPHLMYVKGFYQRPLRLDAKTDARGGGRVTELTARPLLNLFYPELSGFVQPLAGEYAGRREALERVPFFAGYGVEIGLLIDILALCGLRSMGQVDLEERVHRNQSLISLSKMAFEIIQVVMQRTGEARGMQVVDELNKSMKLIRYAQDEFQLDVADIRARERPPMVKIPEYRARRALLRTGIVD
ncbi:MAG: glucosyl-3-phosphoglycerate synthase [Chloroflexi bacterium]|nr:glucosyl-3-phosphoglycerate synthase [Chloroflexota bacterium]